MNNEEPLQREDKNKTTPIAKKTFDNKNVDLSENSDHDKDTCHRDKKSKLVACEDNNKLANLDAVWKSESLVKTIVLL